MDQVFIDKLKAVGLDTDKGVDVKPLDANTGEVEVETSQGTIRYTLKPLRELYGSGYGGPSVTRRTSGTSCCLRPLKRRLPTTTAASAI